MRSKYNGPYVLTLSPQKGQLISPLKIYVAALEECTSVPIQGHRCIGYTTIILMFFFTVWGLNQAFDLFKLHIHFMVKEYCYGSHVYQFKTSDVT